MKIIKRDGSIVDYNPEKIRIAIKKANKEVSRKEKATDAEIDEIITYIEDLKKIKNISWRYPRHNRTKINVIRKISISKNIYHI